MTVGLEEKEGITWDGYQFLPSVVGPVIVLIDREGGKL